MDSYYDVARLLFMFDIYVLMDAIEDFPLSVKDT
jgi:hypothetical protein